MSRFRNLEKMGVEIFNVDDSHEWSSYAQGKINVGGKSLVLCFAKSKELVGGDFLLSIVKDAESNKLWEYKGENLKGAQAKLARLKNEEYIIVLQVKSQIVRVIYVSDLGKAKVQIEGTDEVVRIGGKSDLELAFAKIEIGKKQGNFYVFTENEQSAYEQYRSDQNSKRLEAHNSDKEAARELAQKRSERTREIRSRDTVVAFTSDGRKVFGIPVTVDEWESLEDGAKAVMVSSYDCETGECGDPIKAFFVGKTQGGRCFEKSPKDGLTWTKPRAAVDENTQMLSAQKIVLSVEGKPEQFLHFPTGSVEALRKAGVNGGTRIVLGQPTDNGLYTVVAIEKQDAPTVGQFPQYQV